MEQNTNYLTFELNVKFQMKDYRLIMGLKKAWIMAVIVGAIKITAWIIKYYF
ncbi:MAG: hypothetical protein H7235_03685 [Bdellovibrionaceae bacterium]|nr:hypothetical protein [Pseudobdellovibrionaceae bacterium]